MVPSSAQRLLEEAEGELMEVTEEGIRVDPCVKVGWMHGWMHGWIGTLMDGLVIVCPND